MNKENYNNTTRFLISRVLKSHFVRSTAPVLLLIAALLGVQVVPAFGQDAMPDAINKRIYLPVARDLRPRCRYSPPEHIFGVQMYGNSSIETANHAALVASNADWVRVAIDWVHIEPTNTTPNKYNWRHADHVTGAAKYDCVETILTFGTAPSWVTKFPNGPINESRFPEVAEFLAALVERYDGDGINDAPGKPIVNYIELYNEPDGKAIPNAGNFSTWGNNGALYGKLLAAVVPKMRQANPNIKVLIGGLAYDTFTDDNPPGNFVRSFLGDVIQAGGGPYFDVMNFHFYPAFGSAWTDKGPGLLQKTEALRKKLNELGAPGKEFIITETGWHNNDDPNIPSDDETQMRYTVQLLTQSKAAGLKSVIYFALLDPADNLNMGLFSAQNPPAAKPALKTYQMIVEVLGPARFDRVWSESETKSPDVEVYQFTHPTRNTKIFVAWMNPLDTDDTHGMLFPGETATLRTVADERSTLQDSDDGKDDGFFRLRVGARPILIEVTK